MGSIKDDNKIGFSSSSQKNSLQFELLDNKDSLKISNGVLIWGTSNADIGTRKFDIKGSDGLSHVIESIEVEVIEQTKEEAPVKESAPIETPPSNVPSTIEEEPQDTLAPPSIEPEIPDSLKQMEPMPSDSLDVE